MWTQTLCLPLFVAYCSVLPVGSWERPPFCAFGFLALKTLYYLVHRIAWAWSTYSYMLGIDHSLQKDSGRRLGRIYFMQFILAYLKKW